MRSTEKCSACGAYVAKRAQCVRCGGPLQEAVSTVPEATAAPSEHPVDSVLSAGMFLIVGTAIAALSIWLLSSASKPGNEAESSDAWIARNQNIVRKALRDPDSAAFSDTRIGVNKIVCGRVNSRNGFGGMTGYQRFIAGGESFGPYLEEQVQHFDIVWERYCP